MKGKFSGKFFILGAGTLMVYLINSCSLFTEKVDYNTQVKPLINKKCISCHGGVKAKGGFSLLFREEALAVTESGKPAIIPGDPGSSEFMRRITVKDPEERMPYKHEPLTEEEIALFRNWIQQGAQWGEHWAYVPVKKVPVPDQGDAWATTSIDQFILEKIKEQGLTPSPSATPEVLLRRLSLDLIGMPAPDSLKGKWLSQSNDKEYEALIDRLLQSPRFGERWASVWLDLARYADTRGYEADRGRTIWKYRDWVIDAFNADKTYDVFLKEQFSGDLLPEPTDDQYIATAFHRNSMTNDEGGSDNEEFRTSAVMDRVNTTWTGILGTSFNCVQCHSHPYDPFRHEEYYSFMAFLNNSRDEDTESEYPLLRQYSTEEESALKETRKWINENVSFEKGTSLYRFLKTGQPAINSLQCDKFVNAALVSSWYAGIRNKGTCRLKDVQLNNETELTFRYITYKPGGVWSIYLDTLASQPWKRIPLENTKGNWQIARVELTPQSKRHDLYFRFENPALTNPDETGVLFEWFHFGEPFPGKGKPGYDSAFARYNRLLKANPQTTPILVEANDALARKTHVFERGNWLVKGKEVKPAVPAIFQTAPATNRIQLADWLTSKNNPLTARVMVNRIWEQLFGAGLVETLEDFGTQGIPPTHQELLDHLAYSFMYEDGWSLKKLIRRIVVSATYRQQSMAAAEQIRKDPSNRWYARGPRYRLSAEQIRDQALFVSGILSTKMKGPGVMPYQPEGVWNSPYNGAQWIQSKGEDQYRRAVYTYWKRSAAYPSTITFDGPGRQVCVARRIRTNTPLQALTLLNDPAYLDLARKFAFRLKKESAGSVAAQISRGYELATGKKAITEKTAPLMKLYTDALQQFKADPARTCEMVGVMDENNNPETAALVVVTNALLNLDEVIMKQ